MLVRSHDNDEALPAVIEVVSAHNFARGQVVLGVGDTVAELSDFAFGSPAKAIT